MSLRKPESIEWSPNRGSDPNDIAELVDAEMDGIPVNGTPVVIRSELDRVKHALLRREFPLAIPTDDQIARAKALGTDKKNL